MTRLAFIKISLVGLLACWFASPLSGAIVLYGGAMNGAKEFPANASPGSGQVLVYHDNVLNTIRVVASFTGLSGNTTAAHIHGPTGVPGTGTAGVMTTTPNFVGFPLGVTSGSMDQTYDLTLASTFNPTFVTAQGSVANAAATLVNALASGSSYFNVHSQTFPGGEIRSFLVVGVPEPSSMALLGSFAVAAAWKSRRRLSLKRPVV